MVKKDKFISKAPFSTYMFFRCMKKEYAELFISGKIHFSKVGDWIKYEGKNLGIKDSLEGTYASNLIFTGNNKANINIVYNNTYEHYRKKEIESIYGLCFYGLKSNSFNNKYVDIYGKNQIYSKVSKKYFESFSSNITKDVYEKLEEKEKPVVVFITNPRELYSRVWRALKKLGIKDKDFIWRTSKVYK